MARFHEIAGRVSLFKWNYNTGNLDDAAYISDIGISSVVWGDSITAQCPYCGVMMSDGVCPGCQNKSPGTPIPLGRAVVTFYGPLRAIADSVFNLGKGDVIDVRYSEFGPKADIQYSDGLFRLFAERLISRRVPMLCAIRPGDDCMVEMFVEVECDVQLLRLEIDES